VHCKCTGGFLLLFLQIIVIHVARLAKGACDMLTGILYRLSGLIYGKYVCVRCGKQFPNRLIKKVLNQWIAAKWHEDMSTTAGSVHRVCLQCCELAKSWDGTESGYDPKNDPAAGLGLGPIASDLLRMIEDAQETLKGK